MQTIGIIGTLDTKGREFRFIKELIEERGFNTCCINTGIFEPQFEADVSNTDILRMAGVDISKILVQRDRATATAAMAKGLCLMLPKLYKDGRIDAVISAGGSGGSSMAAPAMRALPIGVPKILISTMASGDVSQYIETSDLIMIPSIVDVEGLNDISRKIFTNAVNAICGMLHYPVETTPDAKPLIAASMFGVTTPCVKIAKEYLERQGYEVLVFHATGAGGKSMESLIEAGFIKGVLDLTTTEWCDEVVGGVLSAGPHRLEAAGKIGIPQVVSVGALDMVNFGPWETVPSGFKTRMLYRHNPTVTLMRTTQEELRTIAKRIADKLNAAIGQTTLMLPLKGVSAIDVEGQPFFDPEADAVLFNELRRLVNPNIEVIEMDCAINDEAFALAAAKKLISLL